MDFMDIENFFDKDESKATIEKLDGLCKVLSEVREKIDFAKAELKKLNEEEQRLEKTIVQSISASGRTSYQSPYGTLSVGQRTSVSIPREEGDREKFFSYLKDLGVYDTMITVNSQTLNAWYKSKKEEAEANGSFDLPKIPGLGEPHVMEIISFRKARK